MIAPSINDYRPVIPVEKEEDFLANLLSNMDNQTAPAPIRLKSRKRKPSPEFRSSSPMGYPDTYSDGLGASSGDDMILSPSKKSRPNAGLMQTSQRLEQLEFDSGPEDSAFDTSSFDDIDMEATNDLEGHGSSSINKSNSSPAEAKLPPKMSVKIKKSEEAPAWLTVYDSLAVASSDTLGPLAANGSSSFSSSNVLVLEDDGSLRFFWLDYLELDGLVYFIGKLKDRTSGAWLSCCITVEGIQRNLYVLPRPRRVDTNTEDGSTYETDIVPSLPEVYADFDRVRKTSGISSWKAKFVKRKYAFGEIDVPRGESQWMKVVYPATGETSFGFP